MKMELIKKLSDDVFADKKQHLMASRIALIMSVIPILSQIMSIFKVNYVIAHMFGAVNALCILGSFVLSVLCIKNQKNRNFMNVCSIIISGFLQYLVNFAIIILLSMAIQNLGEAVIKNGVIITPFNLVNMVKIFLCISFLQNIIYGVAQSLADSF